MTNKDILDNLMRKTEKTYFSSHVFSSGVSPAIMWALMLLSSELMWKSRIVSTVSKQCKIKINILNKVVDNVSSSYK